MPRHPDTVPSTTGGHVMMMYRRQMGLLPACTLIVTALLTSAHARDETKKKEDPIDKMSKEELKKHLKKLRDQFERLQNVWESPKELIRLTVEAPKTFEVKPGLKDQKIRVGTIKFQVSVENIGKEPFPYTPKYVDVAVCDEDGKELP